MKAQNIKPEAKGERQQSENQKPISVCAWCEPNRKGQGITHGICRMHREEMMTEAKTFTRTTQGF